MSAPDTGWLQLVLLLVFIVIVALFLLTQQNTLRVLKPENRLMQPGMVWLQLIPLFGQFWQFIVVVRVAKSIRKEIQFLQGDSIFGSADLDLVEKLSKRPTMFVGITYCALIVIGTFFNLFLTMSPDSPLIVVTLLIFLAGVICWIVYWVLLAQSRKILIRAAG